MGGRSALEKIRNNPSVRGGRCFRLTFLGGLCSGEELCVDPGISTEHHRPQVILMQVILEQPLEEH